MSGLSNQAKAEICKITCGRYPIRHSKDCPWHQASLSPEQTELKALRAQLSEEQAAREQAEAALGEAVGIMKDFTDPSYYLIPQTEVELNYSRKTRAKAQQFLQSPAAKAASERWRAMERVVEAAKKAYEFLEIRALGGEITDELEDALAAYERGLEVRE